MLLPPPRVLGAARHQPPPTPLPIARSGHFRIGLGREATPAALDAFDGWLARRFPAALEPSLEPPPV